MIAYNLFSTEPKCKIILSYDQNDVMKYISVVARYKYAFIRQTALKIINFVWCYVCMTNEITIIKTLVIEAGILGSDL